MEELLAFQVIEHSNGDYYRILGIDEEGELVTLRHDICFDQLGEVLDQIIEKGDMTEEEYLQRIEKEYAG
jgi:hypothetical protein